MKNGLWTAAILAWALIWPGLAAAHADVPMAESLAAEARSAETRQLPIMLLFSAPDCPWCERVKAEYLGPMVDDPVYRDKVIIRRIEAGAEGALIGFDGRETTHGEFAASYKITMVPTIKIVDAQGRELAEPIVGFLTPDYYFGYIDAAVEKGLEKVRAGQ